MTLLCNAYWIDNDCSQECTLSKIKEVAYGFNQSSDLDVTLPSASSQCSNFCASAKSNSSPNTFSIDGKALISSGGSCSGAGGSVQTASVSPAQTFASYNNTIAEDACKDAAGKPCVSCSSPDYHAFVMVGADGRIIDLANNRINRWGFVYEQKGCDMVSDNLLVPSAHGPSPSIKLVYMGRLESPGAPNLGIGTASDTLNFRYNFETGIFSNDRGDKFKNGERVE